MKKQPQKPEIDWKEGIIRPVFDRRPGWKFPVYGHQIIEDEQTEVWYILLSKTAHITLSLRLPNARIYQKNTLKIEKDGTEQHYQAFRWGNIKQVTYEMIRKPFQAYVDQFVQDANATQEVIYCTLWYEFNTDKTGSWEINSRELRQIVDRERFTSSLDKPVHSASFNWLVNDFLNTLERALNCPEQSVTDFFKSKYQP